MHAGLTICGLHNQSVSWWHADFPRSDITSVLEWCVNITQASSVAAQHFKFEKGGV
jgi:hypothetical protein